MYNNRLHAWWSTQSRCATLLSSLIARRWVWLQTLWSFRLEDLSIDEMVGAWCFELFVGPPGFTCWISFAPVFNSICCWILIIAYLFFISWFICSRRWCIDKLGVFHANQTSNCLPGVSWWLSGSSSRCHVVVCSLWLWFFLIILTYYLCVLIHIWTKGEVGAPLNRFKPSSKIFFTDRSQAVLLFLPHLCYLCFVFVSWSTSELRMSVFAPSNRFKLSSKIF